MSEILDNGHWQLETFVQRMTEAAWKKVLLDYGDIITWQGHVRKLHGKKIGFGVVEVTKIPLDRQKE